MNSTWWQQRFFVVLSLLVAGLVLGGCGNSNQKSTYPAESPGAATMTGMAACTGCHTEVTADWMTSGHANAVGGLNSMGEPTTGYFGVPAGRCTPCHDPQGDSNSLVAGYTGNVPRPVVGCEACHGPGSLHLDAGGTGYISMITGVSTSLLGTVAVSEQFLLCTSCHQLLNASGTMLPLSRVTHSAQGADHYIGDTHYAQPMQYTDAGASTNSPVRGYVMDYNSPAVCTNCHNPHGTADINRDWAASKHAYTAADKSGSKKYGPWNHYNMSCDGTSTVSCGPTTTAVAPNINDRRYCQRCHTTTGFIALADASAAGDTATAGAIIEGTVSQITFTSAYKPEMLECNGCHLGSRGRIRNPGSFTAQYSYRVRNFGAPSGYKEPIRSRAQFVYPDASSSNVCIPCHSGRANGESVKNIITSPTDTADFSNLKATDGHDYTSAALLYKALGYEYAGRDYANPTSYRHDQIGSSAVPNTGTGGPCVGCHMYRPGTTASHLFTAVSKSGDTITNVSSEICFNCHAGSSMGLASTMDAERLAYKDALSALVSVLATTNAVHNTLSSSSGDWRSIGDTDVTGNTTGKNNLGAQFNAGSLGNEPGAYIHNSTYAKRLIYDSIDWLDDNSMNYSAGNTLSNACATAPPSWCARAKAYLLPSGVKPYAPSERP